MGMNMDFNKYDRLREYENMFEAQIQENEIHLLGDLIVTQGQVDELAELIHHPLQTRDQKAIKNKFPLTISVFLVWCSVYNYQEGTLWEPIFNKLKIEQQYKWAEVMGDTFLNTIKKHNLQQLSFTDRTKKYMSPILMHGYIGEHYTGKLLDYLNIIYTSYLQYDVSDKAMASMWTDIFNMDAEKGFIRDEIAQLESLEREIENDIRTLSMPSLLKSISVDGLKLQEEKVAELQHQLKNHEAMALEKVADFQRLKEAEREFKTAQQSVETMKKIKRVPWLLAIRDEMDLHLSTCYQNFSGRLAHAKEQLLETMKQEKHLKNLLSIEEGKVKNIKTSILTLGKGREEEGWALLEEYHNLKLRLVNAQERLTQKRNLIQIEDQLQNTSLKMVLTASLNHLMSENPGLFQTFISSTIRRMDSLLKNQDIPIPHRMDQAINQWIEREKQKKIIETTRGVATASSARGRELVEKRDVRAWRLQLPRLGVPEFIYKPESRQLKIHIPQQEMTIPKNFREEPIYELYDLKGSVRIKVRAEVERQKMLTESINIPVKQKDIQGVAFTWFNLREYWPISLEPVMVFDAAGRRRIEESVPNGLYYLLVHEDWHIENRLIITREQCGIEGFQVYEVHLEEDALKVTHRFDNSMDALRLQSSRFAGIRLEGLTLLQGVTMGGIPVGTGTDPCLVIAHQGRSIESMVFELRYQGVMLHQRPLKEVFSLSGNPLSEYATQLPIAPMLAEKYTPYVEELEIRICDYHGNECYKTSFCVIKGTRFAFNEDELIIKIPLRSTLRHPESRKENTSHVIPISKVPALYIDIYYDRIGWRIFRIETPQLELKWLGLPEAVGYNLPLQLLRSQTAAYKQVSVCLNTESLLPQKLVLYDEEETLVTSFHFKKGMVQAPLKAFMELMEDLQDKQNVLYRWEGQDRISQPITLMEVFDNWVISEANIFQTEKETENLFEINYLSNFVYHGDVYVRVFESGNPERILIQKRIQDNPFYLYLKKEVTEADWLTFQIYYEEVEESIFGRQVKEIISWTMEEKKLTKKELIRKVLEKGLVLESFTYEGKEHRLLTPCSIKEISLAPKHFVGEELFKGSIACNDEAKEVFFYLDDENNKLPFLIDEDHDGIQYHPVTGELFFDLRSDQRIMSPLDDLLYNIEEDDR